MLLTPLVPIAFQAARLITDGLLVLQPDDYPLRRPLFSLFGFLLTLATIVIIAWSITISPSVDLAETLGAIGDLGLETAKTFWQSPS